MTHSKQAKTPHITRDTKLLCFDVESNGLHGQAFAVAAVVINLDGEVLDTFTGRTKIIGQVDSWVEQNVLPVITDMTITQRTSKDLRSDFWRWFERAQQEADYVLVSNGYPVEYRFLLQCQEDNLDERYWQHPFPLLDLTSLMLQLEPNGEKRTDIVKKLFDESGYSRHHPYHDALVSARAACEVFQSHIN